MTSAIVTKTAGRKTLDAAMNLVPFIDLLSCCISFLLITAVWSQLGVVATSPAGASVEPAAPSLSLTLHIRTDGYVVSRSTGETDSIPVDHSKLATLLGSLHAQYPHVDTLEIRAQDAVAYHELVAAMDAALAARFVALAPGPDGV